MNTPAPTELRYHRERRELTVSWGSERHVLGAEFLRVHSPSAEVQGHGGEGGTLPTGKSDVAITAIEPVGNYAVKIIFSDGHASGLYSWDWLQSLCARRDILWQEYLDKVHRLPPAVPNAAPASVGHYTPPK
ncbi:MAG TPA: DUF971 domain-containing protein [Moraxellaceae bacterium]|nr:DUF971 domain-containing protein [Moraxellaceae bacterium]